MALVDPEARCRAVIEAFGNGGSIRRLCSEHGISYLEFYRHVLTSSDLRLQYECAQAAKAEGFVEELIDIADNTLDAQHARNRIDARRWYAEKMRPSRYGPKLDVKIEHTVDLSSALRDMRARLPQRASEIDAAREPQRPGPLVITRLITNNAQQDNKDNKDIPLSKNGDLDDDIFK